MFPAIMRALAVLIHVCGSAIPFSVFTSDMPSEESTTMAWGAFCSSFFIQVRSKPMLPTFTYSTLRERFTICLAEGSYVSGLPPSGTMVATSNLSPAMRSVKYLNGSIVTVITRLPASGPRRSLHETATDSIASKKRMLYFFIIKILVRLRTRETRI